MLRKLIKSNQDILKCDLEITQDREKFNTLMKSLNKKMDKIISPDSKTNFKAV